MTLSLEQLETQLLVQGFVIAGSFLFYLAINRYQLGRTPGGRPELNAR